MRVPPRARSGSRSSSTRSCWRLEDRGLVHARTGSSIVGERPILVPSHPDRGRRLRGPAPARSGQGARPRRGVDRAADATGSRARVQPGCSPTTTRRAHRAITAEARPGSPAKRSVSVRTRLPVRARSRRTRPGTQARPGAGGTLRRKRVVARRRTRSSAFRSSRRRLGMTYFHAITRDDRAWRSLQGGDRPPGRRSGGGPRCEARRAEPRPASVRGRT